MKNKFREKICYEYLKNCNFDKKLENFYKKKTILITGGAGAIGSNLAISLSKLVGKKGRIIVLDNLSAIRDEEPWNLPSLENMIFVKGDIRNDEDLKRVFKERPEIIFHLAAFFANQNSVDYPENSASVDVLGQIKLLEYATLTNVERFVYASSGCAIYGSYPKLPLVEDFISMHLTTPYQINKMTGEMYCNFYNHHYGLKTVNCRFFNSYGPGEVPGQYRNVIPNFLFWSRNGQHLPITGDGKETRDFTFCLDLVQGLIRSGFYEKAIGENFNLASGKETSIIKMAKLVKKVTNNNKDFLFKPRRKWDTKPRLLASIKKAEKLIGYKPFFDFEAGFNLTLEWFEIFEDEISKSTDFPPGMSSAVRN